MRFILLLFFIFSIEKASSQNLTNIEKNAKTENPVFPIFKITELDSFIPGNKVSDIPQRFGKSQKLVIQKTLQIRKYQIRHDAYFFPIWIQFYNNKILDFYTRLPSYFLHDTFHQTLINRNGPQSTYILKNSTALYTWDTPIKKSVYSGGCTITCFPIFYAEVDKTRAGVPSTYKPLYEHFFNSL